MRFSGINNGPHGGGVACFDEEGELVNPHPLYSPPRKTQLPISFSQ